MDVPIEPLRVKVIVFPVQTDVADWVMVPDVAADEIVNLATEEVILQLPLLTVTLYCVPNKGNAIEALVIPNVPVV